MRIGFAVVALVALSGLAGCVRNGADTYFDDGGRLRFEKVAFVSGPRSTSNELAALDNPSNTGGKPYVLENAPDLRISTASAFPAQRATHDDRPQPADPLFRIVFRRVSSQPPLLESLVDRVPQPSRDIWFATGEKGSLNYGRLEIYTANGTVVYVVRQ